MYSNTYYTPNSVALKVKPMLYSDMLLVQLL